MKKLLSIIISICLTIGTAGAIPASSMAAYAQEEKTDFSSKRLLVELDNKKEVPSDADILGVYDNAYLLAFKNEKAAKNAYEAFEKEEKKVEPDTQISMADAGSQSGGEISITKNNNPLDILDEHVDDIAKDDGYTIALIDTGVNKSSENITEHFSVLGGDPYDDNGHGTKMLSHIRKISPKVKVLSIKALNEGGTGTVSSVYSAIEYAIASKADVINLSLSAPKTVSNSVLEGVINDAVDKGIVVVGAAGNDGKDAKNFMPGSIQKAVIAGSCDSNGKRTESSNYGESVDLYIPSNTTSEAAAKTSAYFYKYRENVVDYLVTKEMAFFDQEALTEDEGWTEVPLDEDDDHFDAAATQWGSYVSKKRAKYRMGIDLSVSSATNVSSVTVTADIYIQANQKTTDSSNTYYFNWTNSKATGNAVKNQKISVKANTAKKIKTYTKTVTLTTSAQTVYASTRMTNFDTGGDMDTHNLEGVKTGASISVPALSSYTIGFNANGGSGNTGSKTKYYGQAITLNAAPSRTGYSFAGWKWNNSGTAYGASTSWNGANAAGTFYAQWTANKYTVTLDKQGGEGGSDSVSATYNAVMPTITPPTRTGYSFSGYFDQPDGAKATGTQYYNYDGTAYNNKTYTIAGATTLYAQWAPMLYYASFHANGGVGTMENETLYIDTPTPLSPNEFTREGYVFNGWSTTPDGDAEYLNEEAVTNLSTEANAVVDLYAIWKPESVPKAKKTADKKQVIVGSDLTYTINQQINETGVDTNNTEYTSFVFRDPLPDYVEYESLEVILLDKNGNVVDSDYIETGTAEYDAAARMVTWEANDASIIPLTGGTIRFIIHTTTSRKVKPTRIVPEFTVHADDITYGEEAVISWSLPEDVSGTVRIKIGNEVVRSTRAIDGQMTISGLTGGNKTVTAEFLGNGDYRPTSATTTFTVSKVETSMTVGADDITEGESALIGVSIPGVSSGTVTTTVNGTTYSGTIEDGAATITVPNLSPGDYELTVNYAGSSTHEAASATAAFTVNEFGMQINVTSSEETVDFYTSSETQYRVNINVSGLTPSTGYIYADYTSSGLSFYGSGGTVNGDGEATISKLLDPGRYHLTIIYRGADADFRPRKEISFDVGGSSLIPTDYYYSPTATSLIVTVLDQNDGDPATDATGTVTLLHSNGNTYSAQVGNNGKATINLPSSDVWYGTIRYSGDSKYAPFIGGVDYDAYDCCFTGDTKIMTSLDGDEKKIEDIDIGDPVVICNTKTGEKRITHSYKIANEHYPTTSLATVEFDNGKKLQYNPYHPIWTINGFRTLGRYKDYEQLSVGDIVALTDGSNAQVTDIDFSFPENGDLKTYNMLLAGINEYYLEDDWGYYANGILVHHGILEYSDEDEYRARHAKDCVNKELYEDFDFDNATDEEIIDFVVDLYAQNPQAYKEYMKYYLSAAQYQRFVTLYAQIKERIEELE